VYERFGDPHAVPGPTLELTSSRPSALTIQAIKAIRARTNLGLKDAKETVEDCLAGGCPTVTCDAADTAETLQQELEQVGFTTRQLPK